MIEKKVLIIYTNVLHNFGRVKKQNNVINNYL